MNQMCKLYYYNFWKREGVVDGGGSNNRRDLKRGGKGGGSLRNLFKKDLTLGGLWKELFLDGG